MHISKVDEMYKLNRKHLLAVLVFCFSSLTWAAEYPEKPIRFIVPYAAGGGTDAVARLMALRLSPLLGQSIVVETDLVHRATLAQKWWHVHPQMATPCWSPHPIFRPAKLFFPSQVGALKTLPL